MEAERLYTKQPSRTIQQKRGGEGASEMVDNRPAGILQAMLERPIQRVEDNEDAVQGKFEQPIQRMAEHKKPLEYDKARAELAKILKITDKSHPKHGANFSAKTKYNRMDEETGYNWIAENLIEPLKHQKKDLDYRQAVAQLKINETGMPDNLKAGIEDLSGFSMDDVRVHYGSSKPAAVQAHAYTQGTDIHIAPGQERHLPHEAWHVAQQMAGRVQPTTEIGGMPVNDNAALEHEADVMGARANSY